MDWASFLAGFWTLWLGIGVPLAWRKWRRWRRICQVVGGAPWRVVASEVLIALFCWPGWLLGRPVR